MYQLAVLGLVRDNFVAVSGTLVIVNEPSDAVEAAALVPTTTTVAPGTGLPAVSTTRPVKVARLEFPIVPGFDPPPVLDDELPPPPQPDSREPANNADSKNREVRARGAFLRSEFLIKGFCLQTVRPDGAHRR